MRNTAADAESNPLAVPRQRAVGIRLGSYSLRPDWAHLAFVTVIAGWIVWYYFDALSASPNIQNMLLIRPATVAALVLYAVIVIQSLHIKPLSGPVEAEFGATRVESRGSNVKGVAIAILLCGYVAALPYIGFDIATLLFVALSMAAAGERRVWMLLFYPAVFAAVMAAGFRFALSTPVPTLLF